MRALEGGGLSLMRTVEGEGFVSNVYVGRRGVCLQCQMCSLERGGCLQCMN